MGLEWLTLVWSYRRQIAYAALVAIAAFAFWWGFIHNPKVIKQQAEEIRQERGQKEAAYAAINLLTTIGREHREIDDQSQENTKRIRTGRLPGRTGFLFVGGVLPTVYQAYSSAGN